MLPIMAITLIDYGASFNGSLDQMPAAAPTEEPVFRKRLRGQFGQQPSKLPTLAVPAPAATGMCGGRDLIDHVGSILGAITRAACHRFRCAEAVLAIVAPAALVIVFQVSPPGQHAAADDSGTALETAARTNAPGPPAETKIGPIWTGHEKVTGNPLDDEAWKVFQRAMLDFQKGTPREKFLRACKELLRSYPRSRYENQWRDLIAAMEREAAARKPDFLAKPAKDRSQDETIAYWIYQLRGMEAQPCSDPGDPRLFAIGGQPAAEEQLVAIGPAAIPQLIGALTDRMPTRTIVWQRSFYPIYFVLRRQDIAMKCLERISGCRFYEEGATWMHFHMDTDEHKASVLENVRAWWRRARAKAKQRWSVTNSPCGATTSPCGTMMRSNSWRPSPCSKARRP